MGSFGACCDPISLDISHEFMVFGIKPGIVVLFMLVRRIESLVQIGRASTHYLGLSRLHIPFSFINSNILNSKRLDLDSWSIKMVKREDKAEGVKSEKAGSKGKATENKLGKKGSDKGAVKNEAKSLVQTKLEFSASPTRPTEKWAELPPLNLKDDVYELFEKVKELREKCQVYIGAHVSASGGPDFAVSNAHNILGQSFALFLKNQRTWNWKPLDKKSVDGFKANMEKYGYDPEFVLPHASYLINIANPTPEKREKAFENFLDDVKRCELLGIKLYNFHPGSTCGLCEKSEGIKHISDCINKALDLSKGVVIVLENAAGQKNVIGSKFQDLREIIDKVHDKSRVGVCLDTCHLFAAGYDIRSWDKFEGVMSEFDKVVGLKYLKAVHLNDCKSDLNSGLDRHENIGKGKLAKETFEFIVNSKYFKNMPVILETPNGDNELVYRQEVQLMYNLLKK